MNGFRQACDAQGVTNTAGEVGGGFKISKHLKVPPFHVGPKYHALKLSIRTVQTAAHLIKTVHTTTKLFENSP